MVETLSSLTVSTRLRRIAEMALDRGRVFTTLAHLIDMQLLRESFRRLRRQAAAGTDGRTKAEYAEDLESNLTDLHRRLTSREYRATPARRMWIPKGDGGKRQLSIPALEDKIVQKATSLLLEAVYERDFYDFSYGFRPGRNAHQALSRLWHQTTELGGVWLIDADIRGYFSHVPHGKLKEVLQRRVNDGGLLRLVGKWLKVGALEGDSVVRATSGVPEGGVISPVLSNVYLHEALDAWFAEEVQPRLKGRSFLIRYADDFVIGCELEEDARRVLDVLPKRLAVYGLELHPDKTRLVRFRRPARHDDRDDGNGTFEFLGFTHHWGRGRSGSWVVKRRTSAKRLRRAMSAITAWCKRHRHDSLHAQSQVLSVKLHGHYSYYGIKGNSGGIRCYHRHIERAWHKWLARRGGRPLSWKKLKATAAFRRLPPPRLVHTAEQLMLSGQPIVV